MIPVVLPESTANPSAPGSFVTADAPFPAGLYHLLKNTQSTLRPRSRRRGTRHPFPYPILLTPETPSSDTTSTDSIRVLGRNVSEGGLNFYHQDPICHRRVIASLKIGGQDWLRLLIELRWCRFNQSGLYESGGRFLRCVPASCDLCEMPVSVPKPAQSPRPEQPLPSRNSKGRPTR